MEPTWTSDCGTVKLWCADCRDVLPALDHASINAVVTDPPYGIGERSGTVSVARSHKSEYLSVDDTLDYVQSVVVPVICWCVDRARSTIITPGSRALHLYPESRALGAFHQPASVSLGPWGRITCQPILYYGRDPYVGLKIQDTTYVLTEAPEKNGHPCPKPIRAWTWIVQRASRPDETVFDPFMGSGTTGVACVRLGRCFLGVEKEPKYFDIAVQRIEAELKRYPLIERQPVRQMSLLER